jgi:D-hexose-6-phosphate mutarotase
VNQPSPPVVRQEPGRNGLPRLAITGGRATAEIYLHGAHVTAWQPVGGAPVLWVSARSQFEHGRPIRGGVPICFPWFGAHGSRRDAPAHGFARVRPWTLAGADQDGDRIVVVLRLTETSEAEPAWPHRFTAEYRVTVGDRLALSLDVANTGDAPLAYEAALHTYVAVAGIRDVSVTGLAGAEYLDKVDAFARKRQDGPVRFTGETDRVYLGTEATCVVHDPRLARRIEIAKTGSRSTIVWNPWTAKARAMPDFGDDEWPSMVCVETANVGEDAVRLEPGSHHTMTAVLAVLPPA